MWKQFKKWIAGVFGMNKTDIEQVTSSLVTSTSMWDALQDWQLAFYNKPPWDKKCENKSTKFPGLVSSYAGTLCAAELKLSTGSGARADWVQSQIERFVLRDVRNSVQKAAALSFVALKPCVEDGNIYCDVNTPATFFPTKISGGIILAGIFTDSKTVKTGSNNTAYVRLEEHEWSNGTVRITNRAYRADKVKKGAEVPLSVVEQWADVPEETTINNLKRPLFAVLKMPFSNQVDPHSALPVSLYVNAMDSFEEIDRIYNEFLWEISTGKRKQIIDITAVLSTEDIVGEHRLKKYYTSDQFIPMNLGVRDNQKPFDDYTPEMRIDAYQQAMNIQIRLLEKQVGLAAGTFDFDIKSGVSRTMTATEVLADDNDTYNTIKTIQESGLKQGLTDIVYIYDVYATLGGLAPPGTIDPSVEFGDSIFEDTGTEFVRRKALADAGYLEPWQLNAWYFGVDEITAKNMIPPKELPEQSRFGGNQYAAGEDGV